MKTPLLALLAAASVALAATTSTNNKKPSGPTPPGGNKTAIAEKAEKKSKKEAKAEAQAVAPAAAAAAEPVSLVPQTVDATTQMALDAAKAAQAEADKLAAIGTGKAAGGASNGKLAEAAVGTAVVVSKELSKSKKEDGSHEKPDARKPEPKPATKAEQKPAGEKPKPVSAL
jgi:hypothetical protein